MKALSIQQLNPARRFASTTASIAATTAVKTRRARIALFVLWCMAIVTVAVWAYTCDSVWDAKIYWRAVESIRIGHDPYADAIAIQQLAHLQNHGLPAANAGGPFSYVYSPITLPILRLAARLPVWFDAFMFLLCYLAGVLAELWFATQAFDLSDPRERRIFAFLTPVAIFFPGFLASDIVLSGNVAFMIYGLVLATTILAWRRGQWRWFYLAVLLASCVKAPLLSLLAIPILSARRQWLPAGLTAAAGIGLFAVQPLLWPSLFHNYLQAVELQFSFNRDFGFSPAGLFSGFLFDHQIPYSPWCSIIYLAYAIPLFAFLFSLSRKYLRGDFTLIQWAPVLIVGVILLNPRLIEYDVAPLALPLALIAWRFCVAVVPRHPLLAFILVFFGLNTVAQFGWQVWKLTAGPLLVVFFLAGAWTLLRSASSAPATSIAEDEAVSQPA